ncbi:hypothetical protein SAMN02745671_02548 [Anaerovibrio lipolyticus DSM 3074]|uniref:Sigma-70, region 4 n=1 Tax=Anaerovibrio lipolyticus DSM 3074 TaxID=1120997 RepID=A0A1M6G733_9FIRM|nr:hypothetical protein [Anaerovibrio lipolyticus]SHJ05791.1 hypothetical protein SAMN02745671_02548 [Anaerovibrio lipolyticus DSM 3074]
MAKTSGIATSGNSRRNGAGKQELVSNNCYQYVYDYDMVIRLIHNKALIISNRDNGSYNSCELLIDLENIEREYLTAEQRRIIKYKYEYMYTNQEVAEIMGCERKKIARELANIENTLQEALPNDI